MTDAVIERIRNREHRRLLEFIRHTLAADAAVRGPAGDVAVDIERLFASVELLISRYEQPWSPFVSAWSPGLESFSARTSLRESDIAWNLRSVDEAIANAGQGRDWRGPLSGSFSWQTPSRMIAEAITKAALPLDVTTLLARTRSDMLAVLSDVLRIRDPSCVAYLAPLITLARRQGSLPLATLNYDRSVEEVAQHQGYHYDTGIETWLARGELEWGENGLKLLKLHGSIDWVTSETRERNQLPLTRISKIDPEKEERQRFQPAIVFGEAGKLRSEGPYIELLLAWSAQLRQADTLLVIGYSFRDQHVNEVIARWFNAEPTRRIILVDPSDPRQGTGSFGRYLAFVDADEPRHAARRFRHFGGRTCDVLADAVTAAHIAYASKLSA